MSPSPLLNKLKFSQEVDQLGINSFANGEESSGRGICHFCKCHRA